MHLNSGQPVRVYDFEADQYRRQMARERENIADRLDTIERQQRDIVNQVTLNTHQLDTIDSHLVATLSNVRIYGPSDRPAQQGVNQPGDVSRDSEDGKNRGRA